MVTSVNIPPSWVAGRALHWSTWAFFLPRPRQIPHPMGPQATRDDVFFLPRIQQHSVPSPKKSAAIHTRKNGKKRPYMLHDCGSGKKGAGSLFFRIHSPQEKLCRFSIGILKFTFWYSLDWWSMINAVLSQCFIRTSVLWFQSTVPTPQKSRCHPGSWLGIARLHKPPNM